MKHISNLNGASHPRIALGNPPGISDGGLGRLAKKLTKLQHLNLYRCEITDAGLVHLRRMTDVENLMLSQTKVTGREQIQPGPGCPSSIGFVRQRTALG